MVDGGGQWVLALTLYGGQQRQQSGRLVAGQGQKIGRGGAGGLAQLGYIARGSGYQVALLPQLLHQFEPEAFGGAGNKPHLLLFHGVVLGC